MGKHRIQNRKSNTAGLKNRTKASRILISSERGKRILDYLKVFEIYTSITKLKDGPVK